ncbi:hypothetical protein RIVM261_017680 [Rivularia sp. IAM M-261]|nr:hypothetical protein RIVM261_017680 [Rivularia sp. IAM M-261]
MLKLLGASKAIQRLENKYILTLWLYVLLGITCAAWELKRIAKIVRVGILWHNHLWMSLI